MLGLPEKTPAKLPFKEHLTKAKDNRCRWVRHITKDLKRINKPIDELTEGNGRDKWQG